MTKLYLTIKNALPQNDEGQGLVEYGLILALVALAVVGLLTAMGGQLSSVFTGINGQLASSGAGA